MSGVRWDTRFKDRFRRQRFQGFVMLGAAVDDRRSFISEHRAEFDQPGVYVAFAPRGWKPRWRTGRSLPNVISPWPRSALRDRWIDGVELVYVGCAGATPASRILRKRINDLLRHAAGEITDRGPHKGGERLWQCVGWERFELAWKSTAGYPVPHELEIAIGERFRELAGQLPFANVRL